MGVAGLLLFLPHKSYKDEKVMLEVWNWAKRTSIQSTQLKSSSERGVSGWCTLLCDAQISRAQLTWFPQLKLSEEVKSLITGCLKVNTEERLTLADLANHPWLCITSAPKPSQPPSSKKLLFSSKSVCHSSSSSSSSSLCSIVIA